MMDFNIVYLVGCAITFTMVMAGFIISMFIRDEGVDFLEVFLIACLCGAISAIWFVLAPILVLSCVSFLLSVLIVKLFNIGETNE